MTWETLYNFLGIKEFIYFISSSQIQDMLLPVKLIFIFCSIAFLSMIIYLMMDSTWLKYKFLEDVSEFFSWKAYGQREMQKQWAKVKKRTETGTETDYKLAIIDADDFLAEVLDERGYEGKDFGESLALAGRLIAPILEEVMQAHETRNSIVYDPDFKLSAEEAKRILNTYEKAIKEVGIS